MWMMGCSDGGELNSIQDPFTGRKPRPLMPRPVNPPCITRFHGADLITLNHHLATMAEATKTQQVVVSSRWNPTLEQLQTLEELYRRGTRTPSAEQIQHITAQLRRYGKIEGKNVFYWFQNHKARERQKRRRQQSLSDEQHLSNHNSNGEKRECEGPNKTVYQVIEQTKNWASPTNSSTLAEKSGEAEAECKAGDGWVQFDDDAAIQRRRNATWRMMNLSCSSSPTTDLLTSYSAPTVISAIPSTVSTMEIKPQDFINIFLQPYHQDLDHSPHGSSGEEAAQTLQLFPLRSGVNDQCTDGDEEEEEESGAAASSHVIPCQFFEFLPLKN